MSGKYVQRGIQRVLLQYVGWKNITLAKTFEGFGDEIQTKLAKVWVKEHWASISRKHEIVPLTD